MNSRVSTEYTSQNFRIRKNHESKGRLSRREVNLEEKFPELFSRSSSKSFTKSRSKAKFSPVTKIINKSRDSLINISRPSRNVSGKARGRHGPFDILSVKESIEVKKLINERIEAEINRASNRLNRRIKALTKNAVVHQLGSFVRRQSLLNLETSTM